MTYTPLEFQERLSQLKDEIEGMTLTETVCGVGPVVEALDELGRTVRDKARGILIAKDAAVEAMKKERQAALDKLIPDMMNAIRDSVNIGDVLADQVAVLFYKEYVLTADGKMKGKFTKYTPSTLELAKRSFAVNLSSTKALHSFQKYFSRFSEYTIRNDQNELVRSILASLFHDTLRPYTKG